MATKNLYQHYRGEDGVLYGPGKNVEIPKEARLRISRGQQEDEQQQENDRAKARSEKKAKSEKKAEE